MVEEIYNGNFLRFVRRGEWEYVERTNCDGAVIMLGTIDERLVLIEQYRLPLDDWVIELPAGLVNDDEREEETLVAAALREFEEETGYRPLRGEVMALDLPTSAGLTNETISFVRVEGLEKVGPGGGVEDEKIRVLEVSLEELDRFLQNALRERRKIDPKVFAGIYLLSKGFGNLCQAS